MVWKGHLATNNKGMFEINENVLSEIFDCIPCKDMQMLGDKCWETIQPWRPSWRDTKQVRFFPKQCGHTEGFLRSQLRPGVQSAVAPAFFL